MATISEITYSPKNRCVRTRNSEASCRKRAAILALFDLVAELILDLRVLRLQVIHASGLEKVERLDVSPKVYNIVQHPHNIQKCLNRCTSILLRHNINACRRMSKNCDKNRFIFI